MIEVRCLHIPKCFFDLDLGPCNKSSFINSRETDIRKSIKGAGPVPESTSKVLKVTTNTLIIGL